MLKQKAIAKKIVVLFLTLSLVLSFAITAYGAEVDWNFMNWNKLDYGIYWYGHGNVPYKFVEGQQNPAFDPSKPTVIYIHGWQPFYTMAKHRESFFCYDRDSADSWIDAGWNVGVFYWNQFSDELSVEDAEAKIWTSNGTRGMRWRKSDGSYSTEGAPDMDAASLLYTEYIKAMKGYQGDNIRIVGHSLGSQMAIRLTKMISDNVDMGNITQELLPKRVALLDPYFSNLPKAYLGKKWTGEVAREYVRNLIDTKNIPFELYKSSYLTCGIAGDKNRELEKMCAYSDMRPLFDEFIQQIEKHYAAKYTYFTSYAFDPPKEYISGAESGNYSASSKTSDLRTAQMVGPTYMWTQSEGMYTDDPSDDAYARVSDSGEYTPVTDMNINMTQITLTQGEYEKLKTAIIPNNATNKLVLWSSANPGIADVYVDGTIKGKSAGKTVISAETADGQIIKVCEVTVE